MASAPITNDSFERIAQRAIDSVMEKETGYVHAQTQTWNDHIIGSILSAVIEQDKQQSGEDRSTHKFACHSTIVQHLAPSSSRNTSRATSTATGSDGTSATAPGAGTAETKPPVGRRGMNSGMGAYWDESRDGMHKFKWDGGAKGMDIVVMLLWVGL